MLFKTNQCQLIEVNSNSKIIFSDNTIFNWSIGSFIYEKHPLFDIIDTVKSNLSHRNNTFQIPAIHLNNEKGSQLICDLDFTQEEDSIFIVIYDMSNFYARKKQLLSGREKQKLNFEQADFENKLLSKERDFKEEFLAKINHEISNPLTSIKGFVGLLFKTELDENQTKLLKDISRQSDYLQLILKDMIDINNIDKKGRKYNFSVFNIKELYNTLVETHLQGKRIKLL